MGLNERVALVTGAASGIGRATAIELGARGARVACADMMRRPLAGGFESSSEPTDQIITSAGGAAFSVVVDVRNDDQVREAVASTVEYFGRIDMLVNGAGVARHGCSIVEEEEQDFSLMLDVNVRGTWLSCRHAIRQMLKQVPLSDGGVRGRVVNIASLAGVLGLPNQPGYAASKGAVISLTRQIAMDFARHRINVNAITPGPVRTAMMRGSLDNPERRQHLETLVPWPRLGEGSDIASATAFLLSDDAAWITGTVLTVDGGCSAF